MNCRQLFSAAWVLVWVCQCQSEDRVSLNLLSLLPYPDTESLLKPSWDEGPTLFLAQQLAVDHINQRSEILANYSLTLIHGDSGCNLETKAFHAVIDHTVYNRENQIAGILGRSCSTSVAAVSPLLWRSGIDLINIHMAGSLWLADRKTLQ